MNRRFVVAIPPGPVLAEVMDSAGALVRAEGHHVVRPAGEPDWKSHVEKIDILLLTPRFDFDCRLLPLARNLRAVLFPTIGIDPFDLALATAQAVLVGHSAPPVAVDSMAQATVALIAGIMLRLPQKSDVLAGGGWRKPYVVGRSLVGRTVGLIGYGRIGRAAAGLLKPWGARIVFCDPAVEDAQEAALAVPLDDLLRGSDVVSIHASRSDPSRPLIGRREIALMRRDACLVNTSRGGLVDEEALADALEGGRIAAAALDVFETEPLPLTSRLRKAPNLLLLPHSAGHTEELLDGLQEEFLENLRRTLRGDPPLRIANPQALPQWRERHGTGERGEGRSAVGRSAE